MSATCKNDEQKRRLRKALGRFPTGVAIVTAISDDNRPVGMTINSLTSISLAPALLAWSIDRGAASYEVFTNADRFAVTVLSDQQAELAMRFATRGADKFEGLEFDRRDAPVIPDACARFQCDSWRSIPLGDHTMLVGKIIDYDHSALPPLVFLGGQFQPAESGLPANTLAAA